MTNGILLTAVAGAAEHNELTSDVFVAVTDVAAADADVVGRLPSELAVQLRSDRVDSQLDRPLGRVGLVAP